MIQFRSLRSGSSGNLLLVESKLAGGVSRYLVDCGIPSQRELRRVLEVEAGLSRPLDGVLVTHAHSDHINYAALRVLHKLRIPIYLHRQTLAEVRRRYLNPYRLPARVDLTDIDMRAFETRPFVLDGLHVTPIRVPHAPGVTTHAFLLESSGRRLLIASDLNDPEAIAPHLIDCDLVYLESNYDPEMLRRFFNPSSLFHLSNPTAGLLLKMALRESSRPPQAIVLGHLSEERNAPDLALATVAQILGEDAGDPMPPLVAAPRYAAGEVVFT